MKYYKLIIRIQVLILIITSCEPSTTENTTKLEVADRAHTSLHFPADTTKLWISDGATERDTVAIFCQGGPNDYLKFEKESRTSWRYLPNYDNYLRIHLHQANTYWAEMFLFDGDFTMEMARAEVDNTSEMLSRAIDYYKSKG